MTIPIPDFKAFKAWRLKQDLPPALAEKATLVEWELRIQETIPAGGFEDLRELTRINLTEFLEAYGAWKASQP